jgi:hypothetical protein
MYRPLAASENPWMVGIQNAREGMYTHMKCYQVWGMGGGNVKKWRSSRLRTSKDPGELSGELARLLHLAASSGPIWLRQLPAWAKPIPPQTQERTPGEGIWASSKKTGWPYPRHCLDKKEVPFSKMTNWKCFPSMILRVMSLLHMEKMNMKNYYLFAIGNITII